jgi:hypothetical protein
MRTAVSWKRLVDAFWFWIISRQIYAGLRGIRKKSESSWHNQRQVACVRILSRKTLFSTYDSTAHHRRKLKFPVTKYDHFYKCGTGSV